MKIDYYKNVLLFEVDFNNKKCHLCVKKHKKSYFVHQKKLKSLLQPIKKYIKKIFLTKIYLVKQLVSSQNSWPGDLHII